MYSQTWVQKLNGRNVWSLAKDHQGNIYAGGLTGTHSRIWKSTNGGDSWDTIFVGAGQTMWDFSFDQSNNIYVANFSNGLLKSTNNGLNFTLIPNSAFNNKICKESNAEVQAMFLLQLHQVFSEVQTSGKPLRRLR